MKIRISSLAEIYTVSEANRLKAFGFEFVPFDDYRMRIRDHNAGLVEINTLEDVLDLADEYGQINIYGDDYSGRRITIHNEYID